ncbi:uncharacterized protein LOC135386876 isoform X1 [Ornithodoros turicata]|uniref:uncharacterized protein LOC135386876 isoform X1 n=1 Tax=Ornithodoros turicata TaxID=34597 RepID=UPI0031389D7A
MTFTVVNFVAVDLYITGHYRKITPHGLMWDVGFGTESLLNIAVGIYATVNLGKLSCCPAVEITYGPDPPAKTKLQVLKVFGIWYGMTTVLCYLASIRVSYYVSGNIPLQHHDGNGQSIDDKVYRKQLQRLLTLIYTAYFIAKSVLLMVVYDFYMHGDITGQSPPTIYNAAPPKRVVQQAILVQRVPDQPRAVQSQPQAPQTGENAGEMAPTNVAQGGT